MLSKMNNEEMNVVLKAFMSGDQQIEERFAGEEEWHLWFPHDHQGILFGVHEYRVKDYGS